RAAARGLSRPARYHLWVQADAGRFLRHESSHRPAAGGQPRQQACRPRLLRLEAVVSRADTAAYAGNQPQLKRGALTMIESLGQSVANIAPTLTPALNVAVVVGLAGAGSWISYLVATIGLLFV